jgi:hypothetical protein
MHRQKVAEVEKLTQTVRELEESVLAGGAAANAVRDYQRKVQEMNVKHLSLQLVQSLSYFIDYSVNFYMVCFTFFRKKEKLLIGSWAVPRLQQTE